MSRPIPDLPVSVEDYLRLEETSPVKHEYVAGDIYALAGASRRHNRIAGNVFAALLAASRGGPCRVSISDVKLRATGEVYYYPDVMVACGEEPEEPNLEQDPCLLVEVVSPSTAPVDLREKLLVYKHIASLRAYLIVHQDRRGVERHWRDDDGTWRYASLTESGRISCPCPEVELTLDQIYEGSGVLA